MGPRASGFLTGKDGEAGDIAAYRRCSGTQSSRKTSRSKPDRILRQAPRPKNGTCGRAVAIDSANNCYLAGHTGADLFDVVNNGMQNVFIVRFDDMVFETHAGCHGDCGEDMPF